ncbi:hypothetical protein REPUB_Repub16aG0094300 [Reevesia pubescens]
MMSGGGTQVIKVTTTVSLAKVKSDYKELDIAIVKAENHYKRPEREKHIKVTENGPLQLREDGRLIKNEHSWNLESNMLCLESPIGVGFSYSNTSSDYLGVNDTTTGKVSFSNSRDFS